MSNPGFYFYTGDWQKKTRVLTLETKGAWIDLLSHLNHTDPRGQIAWSVEQFARFWSVSCETACAIILELDTTLVACVLPTLKNVVFQHENDRKNLRVTVMSRKMIREEKEKKNHKLRQDRYRERRACDASVTENVTAKCTASSYSSSYSSSLNLKDKLAALAVRLETWDHFVTFREKIKKPLTDHAVDLAISKLRRLKESGDNANAVIEQSILSGWSGLFSVKQDRGGRQQYKTPEGFVG